MKFLIDLNMDGYESPKEEQEACKDLIERRLDFAVSILWMETLGAEVNEEAVKMGVYQ